MFLNMFYMLFNNYSFEKSEENSKNKQDLNKALNAKLKSKLGTSHASDLSHF
jgi:hypothetical protein